MLWIEARQEETIRIIHEEQLRFDDEEYNALAEQDGRIPLHVLYVGSRRRERGEGGGGNG